MTRLDGQQLQLGTQVRYSNLKFSNTSGTSAALGSNDGGTAVNVVGLKGWIPGGAFFYSYSVSPDLKVGFASTGNFGLGLKYDDNWGVAGEYVYGGSLDVNNQSTLPVAAGGIWVASAERSKISLRAGRGRTSAESHKPIESENFFMAASPRSVKQKSPRSEQGPPFDRIALLLQGGGALGSYQAGVYQALAEANLHPDWVAGISIGAINSALIAGNPPEQRVERLREFWEAVTTPPFGVPTVSSTEIKNQMAHGLINQMRSLGNLLGGAPGFFKPRVPPPFMHTPGSASALSYYDVAPLKATLERLVDFDRINAAQMRFSVGAVNVRTGNFVYFDSTTHRIGPAHIMASGSLPPGFPATEIDGEHYWDGGIVSNTPLEWVLDSRPRQDTLAFQVDLWNARGELPRDLNQADQRQKDIRFSSRTRAGTDQFKKAQMLRRAFVRLLKQLPAKLVNEPHTKLLAQEADEHVFNIVHLIYRAKSYEGASKDYEFSRRTMEDHWQAGYTDGVRTLRHPEVLQRPDNPEGIRTFDLARDGRV